MKYLWVVLLGLLLYAILKGTGIFIRRISSEKKYFKSILTFYHLIELIAWTGFVFISVHNLFQYKDYYTYLFALLITIFLLLLSFYFLNDLFAGAIFRLQHHPQIGKYYDFKKYSGKVKKIGSTGLVLETSEGQEVDIPYSQLRGPVFESKELKSQSDVKIRLNVEKKMTKEEFISKIRGIVLSSAYSSFKKDPVIKVLVEDETHIQFEIIISTFNSLHQAILERQLIEEL